MDQMRQTGSKALATVTKDRKLCSKLEKYIYTAIQNSNEEIRLDLYNWIIYQTVGLMLSETPNLKKTIKNGQVGWKSPIYDEITEKIIEHDDFIVMPFEVVEGVVECPKCGSAKTWSVQRQTRSSDEPMTTFSRCATCNHNWRYSG